MWRADPGGEWSYWDLWMALLCVRDHDGDWDGLDAAITTARRYDGEPMWCHLLDLRERLDAAGLSAEALVADAAREKGLITRARARVLRQSIHPRDTTPPMRNTPSARLEQRARRGRWPDLPRSPQDAHDRLVTRFRLDRLDDRYSGDGWATRGLAWDLYEAARLLEPDDGPGTLAVRRAMLTIGLDLAECCDDSYGALGDVIGEALETYAGTDWRSAGVPPELFWPDLLEITTFLAQYGVPNRREATLFRLAGVAPYLVAVSEIVAHLRAEYTAARLPSHAVQVQALYVHAVVAADAFELFETTARAIGPASRFACDAMVQAALESGHVGVARRTLDAADVPGVHQGWVRRRRAALDR